MKKTVFLLLTAVCIMGIHAQKSNVNKAKARINAETPDFAAARELIKPALENPVTKDVANTWYIAGEIGYKENDALYLLAVQKKNYDKDAKGKVIMESYNYFIKAYELDGMPDAKGRVRPKLQKEIKDKIKEFYINPQNLYAYGAYLMSDKKDYAATVDAFEMWLGIPELPMMSQETDMPKDSTYYMITYYTMISAINSKQHDKAIAYLENLRDKGHEEITVHQLLYQEYFIEKKDTATAVEVLKAGFEKYPQEPWFLGTLINYYIYANKEQEAMPYLDKAIAAYPDNAEYYYVKGNLSEKFQDLEQARKDFQKALELNSELPNAHFGLGRLIYNKAVEMNNAANDIKAIKPYNAAKAKAKEEFAKALPYVEKAYSMDNSNFEFKDTLRKLYYNLGMSDKYDALGD